MLYKSGCVCTILCYWLMHLASSIRCLSNCVKLEIAQICKCNDVTHSYVIATCESLYFQKDLILLFVYCKKLLYCHFQAENVIRQLQKMFPNDGLLPIYINPHSGSSSYSTITFGAMGDR